MTTKELSVKYDIPMHILMSVRRYIVRSAADTTLVAYERESLTSHEWRDITQQVQIESELRVINKKLIRSKEDDCEVDYSTPLARAKGDNDDKQSVHTEMV